jgi:pre-mRNA-splicing factor 38A
MQNLIEYIVRQKIYDSLYWKQDCFGLSAERIVDKAVELRYVGGMFGQPQKPSEFICLLLKMLQIQPEKEIILEFIRNDEFKYLRLLGAMYLRLVGRAVDVYNYLEPLLNDFRRVRVRDPASGRFLLSHVDELVDEMLRRDYVFAIALPRLPLRKVLEDNGQLEPRSSVLQAEFEEMVCAPKNRGDGGRSLEWPEMEAGELSEPPRKRRREKWQLGKSQRTTAARKADGEEEEEEEDDDDDDRGGRQPHRPGGKFQDKESLSVEATNALRASLGLAPLK